MLRTAETFRASLLAGNHLTYRSNDEGAVRTERQTEDRRPGAGLSEDMLIGTARVSYFSSSALVDL